MHSWSLASIQPCIESPIKKPSHKVAMYWPRLTCWRVMPQHNIMLHYVALNWTDSTTITQRLIAVGRVESNLPVVHN